MKTNFGPKPGFSLVEIMIVIAIIGLLAAIAIPNFRKAREASQKNQCVANLTQLEKAKDVWAKENRKAIGEACTAGDLTSGVIRSINVMPICPSGGSYTVNNIRVKPVCSVPGHVLPIPPQ